MQNLANWIASILRVPGDWLREITVAIPVSAARGILLVYFLILLVWVITIKPSETRGTVFGKKTIDLRYFAGAALVVQIILYAII